MKTEIKFRGLASGEPTFWVTGGFSQIGLKCFIHHQINEYHSTSVIVSSFSVGQYIGLKDRNRKEIYEDHIVKFKYLKELDEAVDLIGVFRFNDDELRYEIDIDPNDHGYVCLSYIGNGTMYDFEIIGNIHQNKDLLTSNN